MIDIAFATDGEGNTVAHRVDCPDVRKQAADGEPVLTLFGIGRPLPADVKRHSCLEDSK
jgi:hypothetical protein